MRRDVETTEVHFHGAGLSFGTSGFSALAESTMLKCHQATLSDGLLRIIGLGILDVGTGTRNLRPEWLFISNIPMEQLTRTMRYLDCDIKGAAHRKGPTNLQQANTHRPYFETWVEIRRQFPVLSRPS